MHALKKEASQGKTIVASVGNVSNEVLEAFDRLYVLSNQGVIYNGKTSEISDFLASNNINCENSSPIETLMKQMDCPYDFSNTSLSKVTSNNTPQRQTESLEKLFQPTPTLTMGKTFCALWKRNLKYYGTMRWAILACALASIVIQTTFFWSLGNQSPPPPGVFMLFGLDSFVMTAALQIVMTVDTTRIFRHEMQTLKMKYSAHSFFLATWFSSLMGVKLYPVTVSSIAFWFVAMPSLSWYNWFQYVCMYLVLTMMSASYGQMLGIIFKSKRTALMVHFYFTMYAIACSGAIINIEDTSNPMLNILA